MPHACRSQLQITQFESYAKLGGRSAGRDTQDLIQGGIIDSVGRTRQAIEILAQDLARQENQADTEASPLNLGRNEVLISFVLFGLADVFTQADTPLCR